MIRCLCWHFTGKPPSNARLACQVNRTRSAPGQVVPRVAGAEPDPGQETGTGQQDEPLWGGDGLCAQSLWGQPFFPFCCKCGVDRYLSGQCDVCIFDRGYSELFFRSQIYALHLWQVWVYCSFYVALHKVMQVCQRRCDPWYLNAPMNIVELVFG